MIRLLESKPFLFFFRDHLRSTLRITCGRGSFAVHFGDHLRSRDHLRLGIICGTVHIAVLFFLVSGPAVIGHSCCGVPANVLSVCLFVCFFGEANNNNNNNEIAITITITGNVLIKHKSTKQNYSILP